MKFLMSKASAYFFSLGSKSLLILLLALSSHSLFGQTITNTFSHTQTGFPLTGRHISAPCESCHMSGIFKGTPTDCASCHTSGTRQNATTLVKPQSHFATQLSCDSCHSTANFSGAKFNHLGITGTSCASCHNNLNTTGKSASHIPTQATCESCHKSTATWLGAKPDHSLFTSATNCASCHNGSAATGKIATHIPTTLNCISCHRVVGWKPTNWNHTQMPVANQCSTCHSGSNPPADGPVSNHIPYKSLTGVVITNCDSCHKAGFAAWNPGKFHTNISILTQCATCHLTGGYGLTSKPSTITHATVTGNCESCHKSTSSWLSVQYTHALSNAVGTGTCDNCHNGSTSAVSKPSTHIPVPAGIAKCDSCHRSQISFASNVTMNHSVVTTATCASCHNGNYLAAGTQGALAKPSNHIPLAQLLNGTAMDCKACHSSTTSWLTEKMNHNSSLGNGAGWCKSCHATGTSYLGKMQKMSLTHRGGTAIKTDCSQSGCHRPLGNTGTAYSNWN